MKSAVLFTICALAGTGDAAEFFVSPDGDDGAPGTAEQPFRTLFRAQKAVREINRDMRADVTVHLRAGGYPLARPLVLTEEDSRSKGFAVVYRNADGPGQARLTGSRRLTGWTPHEGGVWKTDTGSKDAFHTLYENGRRVRKARYPNYEHDPRYPCAAGRYFVSWRGFDVSKLERERIGLKPEFPFAQNKTSGKTDASSQ